MAATAVVVISSSPKAMLDFWPTPVRSTSMAISSSPGLPSPSALVKRKPCALRSGSHAAQLPQEALAGFKSAAALIRDQRLSLQDAEDNNVAESKPALKRKRATDGESLQSKDKPAKRQRKSKAKDDAVPEDGKPQRKQRQKNVKAKEKSKAVVALEGPAGLLDGEVEFPIEARTPELETDKPPQSEAGAYEGSGVAKQVTLVPLKSRAPRGTKSKTVDETARFTPPIGCPDGGAAPSVKARKPRERKESGCRDKTQKQTKIKKGKVSKPGMQRNATSCGNTTDFDRKDTPVESEHFAKLNKPPVDPVQDLDLRKPDANLELHSALPRKMAWTQAGDGRPRSAEDCQRQPGVLQVDEPLNSEDGEHASSKQMVTPGQLPNTSFASLMGNFGFDAKMTAPDGMPTVGYAVVGVVTKGKRLEMIDSNVPKPVTVAPSKPKAPKKKPRTVTDAATAAYRQPEVALPSEKPTAAEVFFAPRKPVPLATADPKGPAENAGADGDPPARKRKSRAKAELPDQQKPKKAGVKVKKKAAPLLQKLLSPSAAMRKMDRQDILFGTSSQLAGEDSPSFIRDLQRATRESEASVTLDTEAGPLQPAEIAGKSTTLNLRLRASKGLWSAAARDFNDELVAGDANPVITLAGGLVPCHHDQTSDIVDVAEKNRVPSAKNAVELTSITDSVSLNDCNVDWKGPATTIMGDTLAADLHHPLVRSTLRPPGIDFEEVEDTEDEFQLPPITIDDADWSNNDDSVVEIVDIPIAKPTVMDERPQADDLEFEDIDELASFQLVPERIASVANAIIKRPPLQRLSSNPRTNIPQGTGEVTKPSVPAPLCPSTTLKGSHTLVDPLKVLNTTSTDVPPVKRPRGRPRKIPPAAYDSVSPRIQHPPKASAPVTRALQAPSTPPLKPKTVGRDWISIDEIEDSEPEPASSPPRRRSPSLPLPLQLSPPVPAPQSPQLNSRHLTQPSASASYRDNQAAAKAPTKTSRASKSYKAKIGKEELNVLREGLFKDITATVMSCERTTDPSKPSWWEKILMYDPIVLEDLTAWLNEQGVRWRRSVAAAAVVDAEGIADARKGFASGVAAYEAEIEPGPTAKAKRKAKGKAKAKSTKESKRGGKESDEGEMLKEWMVQKWCEEKSICCLWREGLRGGVKKKY